MYNYDGNASKYLDQPYNASAFPSSFYLTNRDPHYTMSLATGPVCFPDLMVTESLDSLTDEEREERLKYNFAYDKYGVRQYPTRDGYYRDERK